METILIGIQISVIGLVVVFAALALIAWILSYFDRIDAWVARRSSASAQAEQAQDTTPVAGDAISPELIAAITAAVAVVLDSKKYRVKQIRYRSRAADPTWQVHGRATIMASHAVPRQKH